MKKKLAAFIDFWCKPSVLRYWVIVAVITAMHYAVTRSAPVTVFVLVLAGVLFIREDRKYTYIGVDQAEGEDKAVAIIYQNGKVIDSYEISKGEPGCEHGRGPGVPCPWCLGINTMQMEDRLHRSPVRPTVTITNVDAEVAAALKLKAEIAERPTVAEVRGAMREELESVEFEPVKYKAEGEISVTRSASGLAEYHQLREGELDALVKATVDKAKALCPGCGEHPRAKDSSLCVTCIEYRDLLKNQGGPT